MKNLKLLISLALLNGLSSCLQPVVWDEGEEAARLVRTVDYDTIVFRGIFDVLLIQDTTSFVKITCGENLIGFVRTHQAKGLIEVSETSRMNWSRSYKRTSLEMHFTRISHISIHEGVNLRTAAVLKTPFLSIWDNSNVSETDMEIDCGGFMLSVAEDNFGIYTVRGKSEYTCLEPDGSAHFRMDQLVADSCHVHHGGIGDCSVNATRALEGEITGHGTVFYKNYPSLKVNVENKGGRLKHLP